VYQNTILFRAPVCARFTNLDSVALLDSMNFLDNQSKLKCSVCGVRYSNLAHMDVVTHLFVDANGRMRHRVDFAVVCKGDWLLFGCLCIYQGARGHLYFVC
jgi:hypothetical protein